MFPKKKAQVAQLHFKNLWETVEEAASLFEKITYTKFSHVRYSNVKVSNLKNSYWSLCHFREKCENIFERGRSLKNHKKLFLKIFHGEHH